ncbi:DUF55-domain-containing protein [Cylindrobasidium torrendii FP15055 ss-10]|uniref:DUF55-domain-containing protein n=1 Tax=Cylindrobasidium torrendii FP15055 ss-10 TaxID=1314674 RepID=A0A0D7BUJ7_9AGAR|nr:DUF55-domain-containing protein [Cylindrobasidium torrendii FP15055 ss-10]
MASTSTSTHRKWLLKAEPDSRIVKGKDVKFSVDDFESVGTSAWEGVRNYEARNMMKEMQVGDKALFYHSNCSNPGIAAFAEVAKEGYPDFTAWDSSHPYFDPKSNEDSPKWFMVDLKFVERTPHFVSLSLLKWVSSKTIDDLPERLSYIGSEGIEAIKNMGLLIRPRLSVQRVSEEAWDAIALLASKGGWDNDLVTAESKSNRKVKAVAKPKATKKSKSARAKKEVDEDSEASSEEVMPKSNKRKAPSEFNDEDEDGGSKRKRRSTRR